MSRLKIIGYSVLMMIYVFFCYQMTAIAMQYIPMERDAAFLEVKQEYVTMKHYVVAFFTHVFTTIFVLVAGFTQFSTHIRSKYYWIHKYSGRLYVLVTLVFTAPSGIIIGFYANGGLMAQIAFCLLGVLWFSFTLIAMLRLRQQQIVKHQQWMLRSFALAMSAITLRVWRVVLAVVFQMSEIEAYRVVAWLGWALNLVIIDIYIYHSFSNKK